MMLKLKINLFICLFLCAIGLKAQINSFPYKRDLTGVNTTWHKISLPNEVFSQAQDGLADLRIFGVKGSETIEVPYILTENADQITDVETPFNIINQSKNEQGFFYTFQTAATLPINQIKLSFKQANFDWKVRLEGSNDNKEWFTVLTDYRILSIKNSNTDYQFTQLNFPTSKYGFYRISVKANEQPQLSTAKILKTDTLKGVYKDVPYKFYHVYNDAPTKRTHIIVNLTHPTPISYLKINAQSSFDFYRTIKIEFATDSVNTEKGTQYNYSELFNGTISSLESPEFSFNSTFAMRLKITIENGDNRPLQIPPVVLKGPVYEMIGRFDDPSLNYALYYGNNKVNSPNYDLKNFADKIPKEASALTVGNEQPNPLLSASKVSTPLFENKLWLWLIMGLIIAFLGFFGYKMLKD